MQMVASADSSRTKERALMSIAPVDLWNEVQECFVDDGETPLPTVELQGLAADEIGEVYLRIRAQSRLASESPTFWHNRDERDVPLDDVSNAAELVASGTASSLSFAVNPVATDGIALPTLSVEVFQDSISLSYSTRDSWDADRVYAFFSWLKSLLQRIAGGTLAVDDVDGPSNSPAFLDAWEHFTASAER